MFQSPILDVATGLVLVFLILALASSSINEYIAQLLGLRGEVLWRAVCSLFQNGGDEKAKAFAKLIYDHDLVNSLSPPGSSNPSYIPSSLFSLALVDRLGLHTDANLATASTQTVAQMLDAVQASQKKDAPNFIDEAIFKAVRPLAVAAGSDLDAFRKNLESWFDSAMQRASGWYKKRVQVIIFCVAFSVSLVLNADAIMIANNLWSNPAARAQMASSAEQMLKPPAGAVTTAPDLTVPAINAAVTSQAKAQVSSLIGWSGSFLPHGKGYNPNDPRHFPSDFGEWFAKLVGILISAIAASLGAPFWFSALGKIVSLRSSGASPTDKGPQPARIASTGGN